MKKARNMRNTRGTSERTQTRIKPRGAELRNTRNKKTHSSYRKKESKKIMLFLHIRKTRKCVPRFRGIPQTRMKPRKNARNRCSATVPLVPRLVVLMYDIYKIKRKIHAIEKLAMQGVEMPPGLSQPEQILFLGLRILHWEYRHKEITREQAVKEKSMLVQEYEQEALFHECYNQAVEIRQRMGAILTEAVKSDCQRCKKLVEIFDGRDGYVPTEDKGNPSIELPNPPSQLRDGEAGADGETYDGQGV